MVYIANIWGILMANVTVNGTHTDPMGNVEDLRSARQVDAGQHLDLRNFPFSGPLRGFDHGKAMPYSTLVSYRVTLTNSETGIRKPSVW